MSRRSHRHGDRGHARPPRLDPGRPATPGPGPGPAESVVGPDRPTSVVLARTALPFGEAAESVASDDATFDRAPIDRAPSDAAPTDPAPAEGPVSVGPMADHGETADRPVMADRPPLLERGPLAPTLDPVPGTVSGVAPGVLPAGPVPPDPGRAGCTSPQLRRFIKSRAYIPMHELRRRFAIEGPEDDVSAIELDGTRLYVGLPEREGRLLAELLRGGDIGAELSYDPVTPVIVGVYPMRPVPRT